MSAHGCGGKNWAKGCSSRVRSRPQRCSHATGVEEVVERGAPARCLSEFTEGAVRAYEGVEELGAGSRWSDLTSCEPQEDAHCVGCLDSCAAHRPEPVIGFARSNSKHL